MHQPLLLAIFALSQCAQVGSTGSYLLSSAESFFIAAVSSALSIALDRQVDAARFCASTLMITALPVSPFFQVIAEYLQRGQPKLQTPFK